MKLWVDDVREAPEGYVWRKSVNEAMESILEQEKRIKALKEKHSIAVENNLTYYIEQLSSAISYNTIDLIDIDHDAGDFVNDGGDYIKLLDWLEETGRNYPIRIHSMNPVGVENMRRIIERNGWKEVR